MAKGRDAKKTVKKKSEKTLKEKRSEKREKKAFCSGGHPVMNGLQSGCHCRFYVAYIGRSTESCVWTCLFSRQSQYPLVIYG